MTPLFSGMFPSGIYPTKQNAPLEDMDSEKFVFNFVMMYQSKYYCNSVSCVVSIHQGNKCISNIYFDIYHSNFPMRFWTSNI